MGKALYRKYRSRSLDEIVGQNHITQLLRQAIAADAISHAYLLTGPKGVGKTSIARIIAHEINQLPYEDEVNHLDIIEIDAASNNGVEDVRDLREKVHIAPSSARKKVYIIDEVHMLSKAAFNALLKTLEEPPAHVVFILATTDVEKLPQTIISRVQRFNFRAIPKEEVIAHLRAIADRESIAITDAALERIAEYGEGSFRDSIGLLDQLKDSVTPDSISLEDVNATLGATDSHTVERLLEAHVRQDLPTIIRTLDQIESGGASAKVIVGQLISIITSQLSDNPNHLALLDELTSINLSRYPYLRLLIAITKDIPRSAPQLSSVKAATKPASKVATSNASVATAKTSSKTDAEDRPTTDFSWTKFIAHVKQSTPAAATLLSQSEHRLDGASLTIYAKQPFRAKRLQSTKYTAILNQSLGALGFSSVSITVSSEGPPSNNSSVAAVTDIMGGGEEVPVDAV